MQKPLFDNRFDKSKSLSDFLPSYKNRSDCYQNYIDYVTRKFTGIGDICECCHKRTDCSKTFKASWKFDDLETTSSLFTLSSLLVFIVGLCVNMIAIFTVKKMNKLQFSTIHVACSSCLTRIKLWRLLSKILQGTLTTLMIVSLIQLIFTIVLMFAQPQMMSIYTGGLMVILCALGMLFAVLVNRSERIGLLGDLSKIAKNPILLESIKFHTANRS
jgi:ABC-type multidrug transport system permease subunit